MEMVNAQTIIKEMILLLGIIGSVGAQNKAETNKKYKLRLSRTGTVLNKSATQSFDVIVDEEGIDNFSKFIDWAERKGRQQVIVNSAFTHTHVIIELEHYPTQSFDSNGGFLIPLYIDIERGDDWWVPNLYSMHMSESQFSLLLQYFGMYNSQNWVFEYV